MMFDSLLFDNPLIHRSSRIFITFFEGCAGVGVAQGKPILLPETYLITDTVWLE